MTKIVINIFKKRTGVKKEMKEGKKKEGIFIKRGKPQMEQTSNEQ